MVRVYFLDDSSRAFAVDDTTTAEQLKQKIVERQGMKEDACFAVFEKKEGWGKCCCVVFASNSLLVCNASLLAPHTTHTRSPYTETPCNKKTHSELLNASFFTHAGWLPIANK